MSNKKKIIFAVLASILVLIMLWGLIDLANKKSNSVDNTQNSESKVAGTSTSDTAAYFSDDAKVMMFYSDYCSWCTKEKEVLAEIAKDGYKVKPMNVGKDQSLWQKYSIDGTPAFIAPDGTKLVGYQDKDKMKNFLDKYK